MGVNDPFIAPPTSATPTLLQYYCTTITQYTPPHRPSCFMTYTIQYWQRQYRVKANLYVGRFVGPLWSAFRSCPCDTLCMLFTASAALLSSVVLSESELLVRVHPNPNPGVKGYGSTLRRCAAGCVVYVILRLLNHISLGPPPSACWSDSLVRWSRGCVCSVNRITSSKSYLYRSTPHPPRYIYIYNIYICVQMLFYS